MMVLVFPVVGRIPGSDYGGVQESLANDMQMVNSSPRLQHVIAVYLVSVIAFNVAGMMVTYKLSAVHRCLLEASRTAVVWTIDLTIHAYMPESSFGETWNNWSWVQLAGFALLVTGQATYGELLTWGLKTTPKAAPSPFASPSSIRSPIAQLDSLMPDVVDADISEVIMSVEEH